MEAGPVFCGPVLETLDEGIPSEFHRAEKMGKPEIQPEMVTSSWSWTKIAEKAIG
jgi:hypothetical protein